MIDKKIKILRTKGFSLREISRKLHISYSTIQRACENVRMSKKGKERYYSKVKGIIKNVRIKEGLNKEKVRMISNLLFDGAVYKNGYRYTIMYVNSSKERVEDFREDMKKVYNVTPSSFEIIKGKNNTYYRIKYLSKKIYQDLLSYIDSFSTSDKKCIVPKIIVDGKKSFKLNLLMSFWENEGSVSKSGKLSADLKNYAIIKQLSKLHDEFDLKHSISRYWKNGWAYKLFLSKSRENYERFLNLNLFSKANVTKGYFIGKKKIDVLKEYFNNKYVLN